MPAGKAHVASPRHSRASSPIRRWRTVSALVLNATLARPDVSLCVRSRPIGRETFTSLSATVTRFIPIADLAKLNEKVLADDTVLSERDLPLKFHPVAVRVSADVTPFGAV